MNERVERSIVSNRMKILPLVVIFFGGIVSSCFAQARNDFPYLAEVISDKVNVRAGQNENFEKIGKLTKGEKVVVVGRSYSWDKIKLPAHCVAYVSEGFLKNMGDGLGMTKGDRINIRSGRGINFSVIGSLKKGTLVRILDQKDGWYKIEPLEGVFGWVQTVFLKYASKVIPPARVVEPPLLNKPVTVKSPDEPISQTRDVPGVDGVSGPSRSSKSY